MSHSINWYIEKRIIYFQVSGDISMEEIFEGNSKIEAFLNEGNAPVHIIVDDEDVKKMPINIRELNGKFTAMRNPNVGRIIEIGQLNPLLRYLMPMIAQLARINLIHRTTVADAMEYLANTDKTLNWEDANDAVLMQPAADQLVD